MNQIKTGALISYLALLLNIVIGLLFTPWVINTIGKEDYGLYTLAMSVISLFVFDFGLGSAITRFISKYLAEKRQDMVDNLIGLVIKLYLIGDFIILIGLSVLYFFLPSIYHGLTPEEIERFKIVYIIAAGFSVISFPFIPISGVLSSYEKFIQLKSCDLVHKLIIVVLMTICLLSGGGLFALVIVNSIAGIIVNLIKLILLGKTRIRSINWRYWDKPLLLSVFSFSIWITVIVLAQRCIFNIAPSILAYYSTSSEVTILGIAICLEGYAFSFANAINGMFLPKVSRITAKNDNEELLSLMIRVGRIQIYIIGLICIGFACVGREFIQLWLGEGFDEVYLCALLIIVPSFFQLPQEIGSTAVSAEGKVKYQAYAFIFMAVLNLALSLPLAKHYGVQGICLSIMIAYFARTISLDFIFYQILKIDVKAFFVKSFVKIIPSLLMAFLLDYLLVSYMPIKEGWFGFIIKVLLCIIVYFCSVWFFSMNKYEKEMILLPMNKLRGE